MASSSANLKKQLTLADVYVISTGSMFSSGFFLLPGLAAGKTGASVVLAYFVSALLIVPAMVSKAELATAMPRAGGTYYFLDRTLGPLVGTIGGVSTWVVLVLKSAFALIGMGAYMALVFDVPLKTTALTFTAVFAVLNILGAKQSTGLLRILLFTLLSILTFFVLHGFAELFERGIVETTQARFTPFMSNGVDGFLGTVGLVFISYVGLTKVASLAEEVTDPDRNIPLGMALSLLTVTVIYVLGVFVMVSVLGVGTLSASLTPVADTARAFFSWIPRRAGELLMVLAAVAAFASMSNAGVMAASRYPLAMSRDYLAPEWLSGLGRFRTPVPAILLTWGLLVLFLLVFNVEQVAKLASSLQLLIFALVNVAVIVMRESRIESYDPGYRAPLYPWMQVIGIVFPLILIAEMGWVSALFSAGVMASSIGWYNYYAKGRLARDGAIYHVFERLGRRRFAGLDRELRGIMKEKGMRAEDPFDHVVARSFVIDVEDAMDLDALIRDVSVLLAARTPGTADEIAIGLTKCVEVGGTPVSHGAALLHTRLANLEMSEMVLVRCAGGVQVGEADEALARQAATEPIKAVFFLVSGTEDPGRHLRILAHLAGKIESDEFLTEWMGDRDEQDLRETLLRDDRFLTVELKTGSLSESLIGLSLKHVKMPEGSLVALIRRYDETLVPRGRTVLREGDRLTIIGEPPGLSELAERYGVVGPSPR